MKSFLCTSCTFGAVFLSRAYASRIIAATGSCSTRRHWELLFTASRGWKNDGRLAQIRRCGRLSSVGWLSGIAAKVTELQSQCEFGHPNGYSKYPVQVTLLCWGYDLNLYYMDVDNLAVWSSAVFFRSLGQHLSPWCKKAVLWFSRIGHPSAQLTHEHPLLCKPCIQDQQSVIHLCNSTTPAQKFHTDVVLPAVRSDTSQFCGHPNSGPSRM